MTNNSSADEDSKTLARVSTKKTEAFLTEFANVRFGVAAGLRLVKRYREFFPTSFPQESAIGNEVRKLEGWEGHPEMLAKVARWAAYPMMASLAQQLRKAWDEPDQRLKEWYSFELRQDFHLQTNPGKQAEPPALTPFEQAMVHFQRISSRAKHCANADCPAPYFIASKRSYKYCSEACSKPAQQAFKREWWLSTEPTGGGAEIAQPARKGKENMRGKDGLFTRNGVFGFRYQDANGVWRERSTGKTKRSEARAEKKQFLEDLGKNQIPTDLAKRTVAQAAKAWMKSMADELSRNTIRSYRTVSTRSWHPSAIASSVASRSQTFASTAAIVNTPAGPNRTINHELLALSFVLKEANLWEKLGDGYEPLPEGSKHSSRQPLTPLSSTP